MFSVVVVFGVVVLLFCVVVVVVCLFVNAGGTRGLLCGFVCQGEWAVGIIRSIRIQFPEVKFLDLFPNELSRKQLPLMFSLIKNGGDQRRSEYVVVFYHKPCRLEIGVVSFMTPSASCEISKGLGSGRRMVARLKLEVIDEKAPPGVELTT